MTKVSVTKDQTLTDLVILREGDDVALEINISGVSSTLSAPTMAFYKRGATSDVSSTYFTGSITAPSIDTIITKTTIGNALKAGEWTLSIFANVDGQDQNVATIPIVIKRAGEW